ncbi:MAG: DUF1592 domain-containing protein [Polyangiales bacterium]
MAMVRTHWLLGLMAAAGCTGQISEELPQAFRASTDAPPLSAAPFPGRPGNGGSAGTAAQPGAAGSSAAAPSALDVGRVDLHRLNNTEYDNTARALLGVASTPAPSFIADEKALGFDNIAAALGMTDAQYEQYFNAADVLVNTAFADDALRLRIVTCTPGSADPADCTRRIIRDFGLRAWRRPLASAEIDALAALAAEARTLGESFDGSIAQVAKAMLSSVPFLYRLELDPDPTSAVAHPLDDYELAARLSFLLWSTAPDDRLFMLAERGALQDDATLDAELERMLADDRAARFTASFGGQWLGLRDMNSHQVEPTVFPDFDDDLRRAMIREGELYFDEFLHGGRSVDEFFTAKLVFPDRALAELYGIDGVDSDEPRKLTAATTQRQGFLGLASFLTVTSFSYRTAPTLRGKWVLENLLCQKIAPPPPNIPELNEEASGGVDPSQLNVRERLAEHRTNPTCAACHTTLDPIGLGLEHFDAIGRYRTSYAASDPIDATGLLPDGSEFDGLGELAELLAQDKRLAQCASEKLMTYALSRELTDNDEPHLARIRETWADSDKSLRSLLGEVVRSAPFRQRRGEP